MMNPDRADLGLETVVLENDAVVVVGLEMNKPSEKQIHWRSNWRRAARPLVTAYARMNPLRTFPNAIACLVVAVMLQAEVALLFVGAGAVARTAATASNPNDLGRAGRLDREHWRESPTLLTDV
jgi:hypothetical protein